ncbi:abortive infection family protein [Chelativorans sp. Marseille-P2723]|uniref:abortive infection family protein n=1 Tax=Chelativorans sp. Marseille-P2723 TaxID=2709133 RepID=UPI001AEE338E|nr:abortive infection family protein [Chelativorans sp. Marseille-P2723]
MRLFDVRFEETGFDNWDGGTAIWTIYILIDAPEYARVGPRRTTLEEQIAARLKPIIDQYSRDWFSVSIAPKLQMPISGWRGQDTELSALTRQNIFDGLRLEKVRWSGVLEDVEFLQRIFDLKAMPSFDTRFTDAASDIWQHRVNNDDWDDDWVFGDTRFNLLHCSSEQFVRFLAEMVHPVVRPDRNEALQIVQHINEQLKPERWHLVEEERIAGRPRFVGRRFAGTAARSVSRARTVADALDAGWMQKEIERLERSVDTDPALAIGTAKELVESCCKSILAKRNVEVSRKADLPELTKLVAKELKLVPDGISDEAKGAETVRLILRNLTALTQYLAELRGMYGSGHGRDGRHRGLEPRHARLAVGAAVAFIDFVADTHHRRLLDDTEVH